MTRFLARSLRAGFALLLCSAFAAFGAGADARIEPMACPTITVSPATLPGGTLGDAYTHTVTATGGTAPYIFAVTSGALPGGLTLSPAGVIEERLGPAGSFNFTITATDAEGCTGSRSYSITVTCTSTITLSPSSLPNGTVGTAYGQNISATGGTAPYTFAVVGSPLPAGLSLASGGTLTGTPSVTGSFGVTIAATDANGCVGTISYTIIVNCNVLSVLPSTLPNGTVAAAYSQSLTTLPASPPATFVVTSGSLPAGLSLASGGLLSGIPTTTGSSNFTVTATNTNGCQGSRSYTINVVCNTPVLAPANLPNGTIGTAYSQTVTATAGTAPFTFAVTGGGLPNGLSLSSGGAITGTPSTTGTFLFTVTATDANGCAGGRIYPVTVDCNILTLTALRSPNGTVGAAFSDTVFAPNGRMPVSFAVIGGSLPAGIALASDGGFSGTPSVPGNSSFTVRATDANGCQGTRSYIIAVSCNTSITLSPPSLTNGTAGTAYSQTITATLGVAPYAFSVTSGPPPAGLSLATGGAFTGTPSVTGSFLVTIRATDSNGCWGERNYAITIGCNTLTLLPLGLPPGTIGTAYSQTLSDSAGGPPVTFTVGSGSLPPGLSLATSGMLSGSPTAPGTFNFTVNGVNTNSCQGSRSYTIVVTCNTLTLSPSSLPNASIGTAYSQTVTATLGTAPYTFALVSSTLPAGLSLAPGGAITGTPANPQGSFSFTIRATDANGCTGTRSYGMTVSCPAIIKLPVTLPTGVLANPYALGFTANGGTAPYAFAITSGTLPPGLVLDPEGPLFGTPATLGDYIITVRATDANGCMVSDVDTLRIRNTTDVGDEGVVTEFALSAVHPNPRTGSLAGRIRFALPKSASVALDLIDLGGRVAFSRASERFEAGRHEIAWRMPELPAGVYFLRLRTDAGSVGYARWVVMR